MLDKNRLKEWGTTYTPKSLRLDIDQKEDGVERRMSFLFLLLSLFIILVIIVAFRMEVASLAC